MHNPLLSPQHTFPQMPIMQPLPTIISARQKIHVSNLPLNITPQQLSQVFSTFGTIIDIRIIKKTPTGLPLNMSYYAFIAYIDAESAEKAIQEGAIGEWTIKPQIDKQTTSAQPRIRSRSRSSEKERKVLTNGQTRQVEGCPKIQIQLSVRELYVSGIPKTFDEQRIRQVFQQFGTIERIDIYPNKHNIINSYIKYFTIDQAILAHQNMESIQYQFSTPIKIFFSDPIKRHNIVGNNLQNEQQSKLSSVLFIFFPPHQNKKVDIAFLIEICKNCQCYPLQWNYFQQDPNYKSYCLLQFKESYQAVHMRTYLQQHSADILGDPKCEVGVISYPTQQYRANQQKPINPQTPPLQQPQIKSQSQPPPKYPSIFDKNYNFGIPGGPLIDIQPFSQQPTDIPQITIDSRGNQDILNGFLNNYNNNEQQQQIQQQLQLIPKNDRGELNIFWSGYMYRSKSHKVGVDAICYESDNPPFQMPPSICVNYKGNFQDAKKCSNDAFKFILVPSDKAQNVAFQEYIDYFLEKNKIGVAQVGNGILYLLPDNDITNSIHQIQGLELLALYSEDKKKSIDNSY